MPVGGEGRGGEGRGGGRMRRRRRREEEGGVGKSGVECEEWENGGRRQFRHLPAMFHPDLMAIASSPAQ
jgi:hypothetical protein